MKSELYCTALHSRLVIHACAVLAEVACNRNLGGYLFLLQKSGPDSGLKMTYILTGPIKVCN